MLIQIVGSSFLICYFVEEAVPSAGAGFICKCLHLDVLEISSEFTQMY